MIRFLLLFITLAAFAPIHGHADSFCEARKTQKGLLNILRKPANLLPMKNTGGMMKLKTGVCWWHSRLQRRMTYLAHFRPDLRKPSENNIKKLLRQIKKGDRVVMIPGYKNVDEFGRDNAKLIQQSLNAWMTGDTLLRQTWTNGLKKRKVLDEAELKVYLTKMYQEFKQTNGLPVQVLNFKGLSAHAWILMDMEKNKDGDFVLEILDSNKPQSPIRFIPERTTMKPAYLVDDSDETNYKHPLWKYSDFVSQTEFEKEQIKLKNAVSSYCRK